MAKTKCLSSIASLSRTGTSWQIIYQFIRSLSTSVMKFPGIILATYSQCCQREVSAGSYKRTGQRAETLWCKGILQGKSVPPRCRRSTNSVECYLLVYKLKELKLIDQAVASPIYESYKKILRSENSFLQRIPRLKPRSLYSILLFRSYIYPFPREGNSIFYNPKVG